jgi:hypothetical protein
VKCDQKRPECNKCIKSKRPCGYRGVKIFHSETLSALVDGDTSDEKKEGGEGAHLRTHHQISTFRIFTIGDHHHPNTELWQVGKAHGAFNR